MTKETTIATDLRDAIKLKHPEADVSPDEPWHDDVLGRVEIAEKLTNLIRDQREPFVISIDGQWGTGKTFLLKRWQKDLEREGFSAIYFNAWEDDFCDDPLLAIIGQLSDHFKKGKLKTLADELGKIAIPLFKRNVLSVLNRATGLTFEVDLNERNLLKEYQEQRQTKTELKNHMTAMSTAVVQTTSHPLVFIVDELDRCRPTFAIELLERVKHIFDVPNVVFVFGINRDELCKSLRLVYGDIDADVYLRRFFELPFRLPEADTKGFCTTIMSRFGLHEFFQTQSSDPFAATNRTDYENLSQALPAVCSVLELSLRDIVYSISLVVLAIRNLGTNQDIHPWPLSVLIPLKIYDPTLYRQFIQGDRRANHIMDYIDSKLPHSIRDRQLEFELTAIEAELYLLETARMTGSGESTPYDQLDLLAGGSDRGTLHLLSKRTQEAGPGRASELLRPIGGNRIERTPSNAIRELARLIDLHGIVAR